MTRRAHAITAVALLGACTQPAPPPAPVRPTAPTAPTTVAATTTTAPPVAVAPTTAATAPAGPSRVPAPVASAVSAVGAGGAADDVWAALARCESGMRNLTGPRYFGFHSWLLSTWRAAGGTGRPDQHTYAEQVAVAEAWLARTSWAQWPACSHRLGLR